MRLFSRTYLVLTVVFLSGLAFAQEPVTPDLGAWFASTAALAGVIVAATAFVRKHLWQSLDGLLVPAFSLALGAALGAAGHFLGYLTGTVAADVAFGVGAGFLAFGGVDGLRALLGAGKTPAEG